MLYNLFTNNVTGISITADDNATVLGPLINVIGNATQSSTVLPSASVYVKKDPYQQENDIGLDVMLVVVGPRVGPRSYTPFAGYFLSEVHEMIEVRIVTRDVDAPYVVSGELIRSKLLEDINSIVKTNHFDPDGTHVYQYIRVSDPGRDINQPQGVPLYKSAMQVEVAWFE